MLLLVLFSRSSLAGIVDDRKRDERRRMALAVPIRVLKTYEEAKELHRSDETVDGERWYGWKVVL